MLLGNHLYPSDVLTPYRQLPVLMVEDEAICRRRPYHQQKLALILSAMRNHAAHLRHEGVQLDYLPLDQQQTLASAIELLSNRLRARAFATFTVNDAALRTCLNKAAHACGLQWVELDDPGFLTS